MPRDRLHNPNGDNLGMGADELVTCVCHYYHVPYAPKHGRGSQLWECCTQLLAFFASPDAPAPQAESTWPGKTRASEAFYG